MNLMMSLGNPKILTENAKGDLNRLGENLGGILVSSWTRGRPKMDNRIKG